MAMVTQGQRLGKRARKRREAAEMRDPLLVGQPVEPHPPAPAMVAVAQRGLREWGWGDRIEKLRAQRFVTAGGFELAHGRGNAHALFRFAPKANQPRARRCGATRQIAL